MNRFAASVQRALASKKCFYAIIGVFIFEALWIALSAQFPMAFDEDFHFGIIHLYADHWLPFLFHAPAHSEAYGAVAQDPSYLYHYLMSFPYRLMEFITHNDVATIIALRLINIALATWALIIFRTVLLRSGLGRVGTHVLLAAFAAIPIAPLLAGQINYDNLAILIVAILALRVQSLLEQIKKHRLSATDVIAFLILALLGSIVKYALLPIFAATAIFVAIYAWLSFRKSRTSPFKQLGSSWHGATTRTKTVMVIVLVVAAGLFSQRYVLNTIVYHNPIPDCSKILSEESCQHYGPWNRDHLLALSKSSGDSDMGPLEYFGPWLYGMWYRLFFVINGNITGNERFQNYPPLPVIGIGAVVLTIAALAIFLVRIRSTLKGHPVFIYFLLISLAYAGILFAQNYSAYLRTGQPVAVNGRYLLLVILLAAAPVMYAVSRFIRNQIAQVGLLIICLFIAIEGGGLISFMVRSNNGWYWDNSVVQAINNAAHDTLEPRIIGGSDVLRISSP